MLRSAPAIAAVVTKLIYQRKVSGLGWGWGKTRSQIAGVLNPLSLGLVGLVLVWLKLGGLYDEAWIAETRNGIADTLGLTASSVVMLNLLVVGDTVGLLTEPTCRCERVSSSVELLDPDRGRCRDERT